MTKRFAFLLLLFLLLCGSAGAQEAVVPDTLSASPTPVSGRRENFLVLPEAPPVEVRQLPQEKLAGLKKSEDYWYANREPEKPESPKAQPSKKRKSLFQQSWFQNLLWIVILCSFIGVVVWYLAASNVSLFRRKAKALSAEEPTPDVADDIFSLAYDREIAKAEAAQNYRLALRLGYLRTLKTLSDKGLIDYRPERPNGDYVQALFGSRHYTGFFRLTRSFDYTWYGQFPLSAETYRAVKSDFQTFQNSLSA